MTLPESYCGKILTGLYSPELQKRVGASVSAFQAYDISGVPAIPYISAWEEGKTDIWYEFISTRFCDLLDCSAAEAVAALKKSIVDRRVYSFHDVETKVQEEVLSGQELHMQRSGLREEGKKTGIVEAVYKITVTDDTVVWLKDQATIETYGSDRICISLGCLTDVTKEMEQKSLLEKIGYFDELTNLPNRNIMYRILEIHVAQFQRKSIQDFIFLMLDIDHFKQVNDTYGHQAGDYVLATLAEVMSVTKRKGDEIGRYGGEEFYGLTHGDIRSGWEFAERLRQKVEKTPFLYKGQKIHVTISVGLASATQLAEINAESLITTADKRLYIAKQSGRNQVVASDDAVVPPLPGNKEIPPTEGIKFQ